MPQTTAPSFLAAFRANLAARPGLAGVGVDLVPTADTSSIERLILIAIPRIEGSQEQMAMNIRRDRYRIPGRIDTFAADPDSDVAFQTALNRAGAILDELILELDDNRPPVGLTSLDGIVDDVAYTPYTEGDGGWRCRCDFVVNYSAAVT
jgi:hypothetical protein